MVTLSNGDLLVGGSLNNELFLARWNTQGDTLWTRTLPLPPPMLYYGPGMRLLSTGEILVRGTSQTYLIDAEGEFIASLDVSGQDVVELGPDSLLACTSGQLTLKDRNESLIWQVDLVSTPCFSSVESILLPLSSGFIVFSGCHGWQFGSKFHIGRYALDGTFIDTVRVGSNIAGPPATPVDFRRTTDGGGIGLGFFGVTSGDIHVIKLTADADTAWISRLDFNSPMPPGFPIWFTPQRVVERSDGSFVLAGAAIISLDESAAEIGMIVLDESGSLSCYQPIYPAGFDVFSFLEVDLSGVLHAAYDNFYGPAESTIRMEGHGQLCLPEIEVEDLFPLPDGGLIGIGNSSGELVLKHWNANGVLQWAQAHAGPATYGACLLNTGTLLVPGSSGTRSFSTSNGSLLGMVPGATGHLTAVGADSLLYCGEDGLSLWTGDGTLLWEVPLDLPMTDPGSVSARALRTGDGIMVYGGVSEDQSATALVTLRYTLSGTYAGEAAIHPNDGSIAKVHALVPALDGGSVGVATTGTGTTKLVRCNVEGDTLWTRHFGVDAPLDGFPAFFHGERIVALNNGRYVLAGITGDPLELALLVLDAQGGLVCMESVSAVYPAARFAMALDALERVQVLRTEYADGAPEGETLTSIAVDQLCLSTGGVPAVPASSCMRITPMPDGWLVDRSGCAGGAFYTIHDAAGRQHASGRLGRGSERIMASSLPQGVHVLRVMEEGMAAPTTLKWAVVR